VTFATDHRLFWSISGSYRAGTQGIVVPFNSPTLIFFYYISVIRSVVIMTSQETVPRVVSRPQERVIPVLAGGRYTSGNNVPHDFLEGRMRVEGILPASTEAIWAAISCPEDEVSVSLPVRVFDRKNWTCFLCCDSFDTPFGLDDHVPRAHPVEHRLWLEDKCRGPCCRWMFRCFLCG
jgi:hypothetical protein